MSLDFFSVVTDPGITMTSANPANPLTRAEFYNACTSVLQGLTCLQRQGAVVNEEAIETLDRLGLMVQDLRSDVQSNKEFYVDGPLVRCKSVLAFVC